MASKEFTGFQHFVVDFRAEDHAALAVGIPILVPAPGLTLLDAWIEVITAFNGTTPKADIGTFSGQNTGLYNLAAWTTAVDLTAADGVAGGAGLRVGNAATFNGNLQLEQAAGQAGSGKGRVVPAVFTDVLPLLVLATQSGQKGGTALDSTAGYARAHAIVCPGIA